MYKLYVVDEDIRNYGMGDTLIARDSERLEGYVLTTHDELIEKKNLTEIKLGSDISCSEE